MFYLSIYVSSDIYVVNLGIDWTGLGYRLWLGVAERKLEPCGVHGAGECMEKKKIATFIDKIQTSYLGVFFSYCSLFLYYCFLK